MRARRWWEGNCGRPEACHVTLGFELNEVGEVLWIWCETNWPYIWRLSWLRRDRDVGGGWVCRVAGQETAATVQV